MFTSKVEETIKAPVKKLFSSWSDPAQLSKWFTSNAKQEFRVGGSYSNDDKDEGIFLEIEDNRTIRFTWENKEHCPNTEVTLEFESPANDTSKITIIHSKLATEEHYRSMNTGWKWAVYSLKSYLETGKAVMYNEWEKLQNPKP